MKDKTGKKGKGQKANEVGAELHGFCEGVLQSTEIATAMDTFANWNGDLLLGDLPPDAPTGLRESIEAVNKVIAGGKPIFDALVERLEGIQDA